MARPIEFDSALARNQALVLFWRKGYQATSLPDLLAAMDIGRSSFYAAYSDKRSLFLASLDLFAERTLNMLAKSRAHLAPLDALQDFFERNFTGPRVERGKRGCMLVNTVLEMAEVDDELAARARHHLTRIEASFMQCFMDADFSAEDAREMAVILMVVNEGIRVSSRRDIAPLDQLQMIRATFRLIRKAVQGEGAAPQYTRVPAGART